MLLLPVDLVDPALNVSEPSAEDLAVIVKALALTIFSFIAVRLGSFCSYFASFPLSREFGVAHAKQLCVTSSIRPRNSHQFANSKLMAFPQHERLLGFTPAVSVETVLNPAKQVRKLLGTTMLFCGETCKLCLLP
jgi:hypothetical protein